MSLAIQYTFHTPAVAAPAGTPPVVGDAPPVHLTRTAYHKLLRHTWRRADPIPNFILLNSRQPVVPLRNLQGAPSVVPPPFAMYRRNMRWFKQRR